MYVKLSFNCVFVLYMQNFVLYLKFYCTCVPSKKKKRKEGKEKKKKKGKRKKKKETKNKK